VPASRRANGQRRAPDLNAGARKSPQNTVLRASK
jgi:hypothetical protein